MTTDPDPDKPARELHAALSALQGELDSVTKGKKALVPHKGGGSHSYAYADLASISSHVLPLLSKHGLAFTCTPISLADSVTLRGVLTHSGGGAIEGSLPIFGRTPQEIGSSITYMRRYLLGCLTGVVTDEDDDGQKSQGAQRTKREASPDPLALARQALTQAWAKEFGEQFDHSTAAAIYAQHNDGLALADATPEELTKFTKQLPELAGAKA